MIYTILWRRLDLPGHEFCKVEALNSGWLLTGATVFAFEVEPCQLNYRIFCNAEWWTNSAEVKGYVGQPRSGLDAQRS
ncbi:MAG: putative glycolipid-binding domain-containing protein [Ardenticatenaceae bacterium]|nr:putative glycolipid-binding domain-containing protein [Ardenticatenaceae bacterium]